MLASFVGVDTFTRAPSVPSSSPISRSCVLHLAVTIPHFLISRLLRVVLNMLDCVPVEFYTKISPFFIKLTLLGSLYFYNNRKRN